MELEVWEFLDLVQHWMFSSFDFDKKDRAHIRRTLMGPLRTMGDAASKIPAWAPAWWAGDEDASDANFAAMKAFPRR